MLGGLTVLFFLPAAISTAHAGLAEIFFCMTVAIALFTSPAMDRRVRRAGDDAARSTTPRSAALATDDDRRSIYAQILVGATMRHTGAGLAIPDFPLMFGHLLPDHWDPKIAIHFAHRVGALRRDARGGRDRRVTSGAAPRPRRELVTRPAALLVALVAVQVTLGALTVLSRRDIWINSLHVVCGALVLTTSLVLTLRTWRVRFADADG